jgi:hypothetical protein
MRDTHSADADVDLTLRAAMTAPDAGSDPYLSPPVDAEQLALLHRYGQERPTTAGQVLFREGDRGYDFIVVLSGPSPSSTTRPGWCVSWPPGARVSSWPS